MGGVTYDTGALIAGERNKRAMWVLHAGYLAEEVCPTVPAPVLAEAWRGGGARQANLVRLLVPCQVEPMSDAQARAVGVLAGATGHDDVVDLTVAEGALRRGDAVVTSDDAHLASLTRTKGSHLPIVAI
jgi:hypothetical protein